MLKPAILFKESLPACFVKASTDFSNRFYSESYWTYEHGIKDNNWECHQLVSVDNSDNIVGYFSVTIDRGCHFVHSMSALRFEKGGKYDILFAKDFKKFFMLMFMFYKYNKVGFQVCIGSPYEAMYDKFVNKYGGRIIGFKKDNWKLMDGTICDIKLYEIMREDFEKVIGMKTK